MIGCDCSVCGSRNPRNNRDRCSVLIHPPRGTTLIDTTPEPRLHPLRAGKPHPSHFSLEQALEAIARARPRQAYITHMGHTMDYDAITPTLPPNVALAYDGLSFRF